MDTLRDETLGQQRYECYSNTIGVENVWLFTITDFRISSLLNGSFKDNCYYWHRYLHIISFLTEYRDAIFNFTVFILAMLLMLSMRDLQLASSVHQFVIRIHQHIV
jgi:hypothetical protein